MHKDVLLRKAVIKLVSAVFVLPAFFFIPAGTWRWPEAWIYFFFQISFSISLFCWLRQNNPRLLRDRMIFLKKSAKSWDKAIVISVTIIFIPFMILPGFDAKRFQWCNVPLFFKVIGFAAIFLSAPSIFWIMKENAFLSRIVEIQKDQGHKVIETGPYRYIRHPMYATVILWILGIPLALGSFYTLIPGGAIVLLILLRTYLEDKTLHRELDGYSEYAVKVRYRLIPFVW